MLPVLHIRRNLVRALPSFLRVPLGRALMVWRRRINAGRDSREVFDEIYRQGIWGGRSGELCSGHGSVEARSGPYCEYVAKLLDGLAVEMPLVLDIGCGDLSVAKRILTQLRRPVHYIGIDVAPTVIAHHQASVADLVFPVAHRLEFICADAAKDVLPTDIADVCLIRQVLQHLSNLQIKTILKNVATVPVLVVTEEHLVNDPKLVPNIDKAHGPDTRLTDHSGVYLDKPPFSVPNIKCVVSVKLATRAAINTYLIEQRRFALGKNSHAVD